MKALLVALALASTMLGTTALAQSPRSEAQAQRTITGIPLDAPWKQRIYAFAREQLKHPAWGWTHSERDYILASEIGAKEGLAIDRDILFATAFTHDIGAIGNFQKEGVDHAARSAELAVPLLRDAGFPETKLDAVREAILGHMHDKPAGRNNEGILLHDADTLDFLGSVGVARRLATTGNATDYSPGVGRIREFADKLPGRLVTRTAKGMAARRVKEMRQFLLALDRETAHGQLR